MVDEVRIGGLNYIVSEVGDLAHEERSPGMLGCINYHELTIKLEKELHHDMKQQTLVHELVHGIFVESGYEEHEEEMVNRIGKVMYQVLKDNDFSFLHTKQP